MLRQPALLLLTACAQFATNAQPKSIPPPKSEVRAVWIATASSLDWPHSFDKIEQQTSLRKMLSDLRSAHFNTIFFQARARGDAYYKSSYEPWAENLTGTLGKDPGWDPLEFLL
ncbi:MAG: family 10 glycosylhydrolase, partial [Ignavibacteria bacterium]|nr:family 10 glycosylhydrolase [Ignavibacteria bacterium]